MIWCFWSSCFLSVLSPLMIRFQACAQNGWCLKIASEFVEAQRMLFGIKMRKCQSKLKERARRHLSIGNLVRVADLRSKRSAIRGASWKRLAFFSAVFWSLVQRKRSSDFFQSSQELVYRVTVTVRPGNGRMPTNESTPSRVPWTMCPWSILAVKEIRYFTVQSWHSSKWWECVKSEEAKRFFWFSDFYAIYNQFITPFLNSFSGFFRKPKSPFPWVLKETTHRQGARVKQSQALKSILEKDRKSWMWNVNECRLLCCTYLTS